MKAKVISKRILGIMMALVMVLSTFAMVNTVDVNAAEEPAYFTVYVADESGDLNKAKVLKEYTKSEFTSLCNSTEIRSLYFRDKYDTATNNINTTMRVHISTKQVGIMQLLSDAGINSYWKDGSKFECVEINGDSQSIYTKFSLSNSTVDGDDLSTYTNFYGDTVASSPGVQANSDVVNITPSISIEGYREEINSDDNNSTKASAVAKATSFSTNPLLFIGAKDQDTPLEGKAFASGIAGIVLSSNGIVDDVTLNTDGLKNATATVDKNYSVPNGKIKITVKPNKGYKFETEPTMTTSGNFDYEGILQSNGDYVFEAKSAEDNPDNIVFTVSGSAVNGSAANDGDATGNDSDKAGENSDSTVDTGDETMILPFIILMLLAASGGAFVVARKRS